MTYLETAHRNIAWFNDRHRGDELEMHPPFQRNPVWTDKQKKYLLDTILRGLPIPELYMQDIVDENGAQQYIVVDGQQRTRACLEFVAGEFPLDPQESPEWGEVYFEELPATEKQKIFRYKFVVRTLPEMPEPQLRGIFKRLNRNVVALNAQELRHATYSGFFINAMQQESDVNPFWGESGIFSTNDIRRMLDVEYISELAVGVLHGPQDKKKKLDDYYQRYETTFEEKDIVRETFQKTTAEISVVLNVRGTRWRRKSDFYSLFLVMAAHSSVFPLSRDARTRAANDLNAFADRVTEFLKIDLENADAVEQWPRNVARYGIAVERAASDLASRRARQEVLEELLAPAFAIVADPEPAQQ
jgi:hypothetical protein